MFILAEISDKMATIPQLWTGMGIFGILLLVPGFIHRFVAILMFLFGVFFSGAFTYSAYHEAFIELNLSHAVQNEMGTIWIAHSIISSLCPVVFTGVFLFWRLKRNRIFQHHESV